MKKHYITDHQAKGKGVLVLTACGPVLKRQYCTNDTEQITCKTCVRTHEFMLGLLLKVER